MQKISVIVPVYNGEKHIRKCVQSIIDQSFKEFELILVDDGSTDDSLTILKEFKESHPHIVQVITQSNRGVSVARNRGILESHAPYIIFVDSDDWLEEFMFEYMYESATENDSDLVLCNARVLNEDKSFKKICYSGYLNSDIDSIYDNKSLINTILPVPWGKLYKKSLFIENDIFFPEGLRNQDLGTTPRILCHCKKISKVNRVQYNYVHRNGSAVRTYDYKILDIVKNLKIVKDYYIKNGLLEEFKQPLEYLFIDHLLFRTVRRLSFVEDSIIQDEMTERIITYLNHEFPSWHKNFRIKSLPMKKRIYLQMVHKGYLKKVMAVFNLGRKLRK